MDQWLKEIAILQGNKGLILSSSWGCGKTLPTGDYKPLWVTPLVGRAAES